MVWLYPISFFSPAILQWCSPAMILEKIVQNKGNAGLSFTPSLLHAEQPEELVQQQAQTSNSDPPQAQLRFYLQLLFWLIYCSIYILIPYYISFNHLEIVTSIGFFVTQRISLWGLLM